MTRLEAARERHAHDDVAGDNQFWQPPGYGNAGLRAHEDRAYLLGLVDEMTGALETELRTNHPGHGVPLATCGLCQPSRDALARLEETT